MQRIADWLEKLGMSEYAQRFVDNAIDLSVLPDLTDQDLEKLGVLLGHRRKMLRAIAALGDAPPAEPTTAAAWLTKAMPISAAVGAPSPAALADAAGERRYLTVMFCDLVGSTGISAQLDAEEWRDLVGAYLDAASTAVTELGGRVAKKLGDGLMSLFGYPVAQENDSERAVRAAFAIQRALAELNRKNAGAGKPELTARIGLETGPVVVDAAGEIFGDAPNVAARVQALAEPGAVLVTARVQRQVAGLFVAEERGTHTLKGVPEPVALFRLIRASGGGRRSGARNLTPLIGRDDEMALLTRRWERARQGDGQLVLIVGEPGLGKSRLIEEFHARLSDTPHTWVEWSCSQLLQNTPLHPVAEWGRQRFGGADVPAERRMAELESSLSQVKLDPTENVPLLAPLLDIPLPQDRVPALAPEELRRRQLAALTNWVMAGARVQPVVLAFEDLHWADPTTLDVLRGIAERGALAPLYIVATTRPEFRVPWSMRSHHGTISLAPLDRLQVREMVAELAARHALPRDVVEDVAARTGGVPLFVEEVTRLLLERGEHGGGIEAIPPTLQQSLMARLDRLGSAREVAQVGSVIGRGFSYDLLRDVAGMEDAALQAALERLAEADILLVQGLPPESDYRFKHALIQDAAYENLLKSRRQVLHRRVAEILRGRFADTAAAEPEALAYHFTQAGMTDAAIEWWGKAGDQALRRSAFQEAISHLGKAIEMADKTGDGAPRPAAVPSTVSSGQRLKLQTNLGQALLWARGHSMPKTKAAFARAREIARQVENAADRFSAYYGQWVSSFVRGEIEPAREAAELFLHEVEADPSLPQACVGHRIFGTTCWYMGKFAKAHEHLQRALDLFDRKQHYDFVHQFGQDVASQGAIFHALALYALGHVDEALRSADQSAQDARTTAHVPTLAQSHYWRLFLGIIRGRPDRVLADVEAFSPLVSEHGLRIFAGYLTFAQGWLSWYGDKRSTGLTEMSEGISYSREQGILICLPFFEAVLAEGEAETGKTDSALARLDREIAEIDQTGERWCEAELHRIRGEILLKRDPANTAPAEEAFLTAIAIARQQKARSFELRAALSLAKLYQSTNRAADAYAVLAPALEGFSPTPEFPEIEEAQTSLAALIQREDVKNAAASRQRRLKLQTSYGLAVAWARGFAAEETKAAFTRAEELSPGAENSDERFTTLYGQWVNSIIGGEFELARKIAETFIREAKSQSRMPETMAGLRYLGLVLLKQGLLVEARTHLEEVLRIYDPGRDREAQFRFGTDSLASATIYLAEACWQLGDFSRARELGDEAIARAVDSAHGATLANTWSFKAGLEMYRGDAEATMHAAETLAELSREHGLALFLAYAAACSGWARARLGDEEAGLAELRQALATFAEQGAKFRVPYFQASLAEIEAKVGSAEGALIRIDAALALANATGEHQHDGFLHRVRGETLLKRDPANTAPAEEAFLAGVVVARQQKARSLELRAALSLAKLYQSTGRAADAHAVLASALEGFAPTPEFPEIEEAQALLAALAETDEVRQAAASRERRLKLQTSLGRAMMWSRGFGSEEAKAAFSRAQELAAGSDNAAERFTTYYGLWVGAFTRGELGLAQNTAETFWREAENGAFMTEASVSHYMLGFTRLMQGDLTSARTHLEEALKIYDPQRDRDAKFRFGTDCGATTTVLLGLTNWLLGEFGRARQLIDNAVTLAVESAHAPSLAHAYRYKALFEILRGDAEAARQAAETVAEISQEHGVALYLATAKLQVAWARAQLGDREAGRKELQNSLSVLSQQGNKAWRPLFHGLLAQIEADAESANAALSRVDEALTLASETGERWTDALIHCIRGEILLKREPASTAPAEEAFLTAIAIAQRQKARSFELRAAMSMARLWRDQGKPQQARELLAPVYGWFTEGFDTLDLKEAKALLDELTS